MCYAYHLNEQKILKDIHLDNLCGLSMSAKSRPGDFGWFGPSRYLWIGKGMCAIIIIIIIIIDEDGTKSGFMKSQSKELD